MSIHFDPVGTAALFQNTGPEPDPDHSHGEQSKSLKYAHHKHPSRHSCLVNHHSDTRFLDLIETEDEIHRTYFQLTSDLYIDIVVGNLRRRKTGLVARERNFDESEIENLIQMINSV